MIAVPPGLLLVLPPQRLGLHRVLADEVRRHPFDDRLGGEVGLRELGDRLAPADLAVIGGDLAEAEVAERVEVVRLRIAHRNRFDLGDLHSSSPNRSRRGRAACLRRRPRPGRAARSSPRRSRRTAPCRRQ